MKRRIRLKVAYDGTAYCGWQLQKNGPTIEGELHRALTELTGSDPDLIGASRTDAGVHSLGNVAVFDTDMRMPAEKFSFALNQRLPDDIVVLDSCEVPADWHPRHCSSTKTYEYRILNRTFPDPTQRLYTYFFHRPLDAERMDRGAAVLIGTHDFKSFCSVHTMVETTVRTITECSVFRSGELITVRVSGNGFLYNMVRIIAGTLIQIGTGERDPEDIRGILEARDRQAAGPTAPANGLTMIDICYKPD